MDTLKVGYVDGLNTSHFYIMCKNLPQLRQIFLRPRFPMNPALISDIIRNADQLEWIHLSSDNDSCDKPLPIVPFLAERSSDTPLQMSLCAVSYTTKHTIPVKASEGTFTLLICGGLHRCTTIEVLKTKLPSICGAVNDF